MTGEPRGRAELSILLYLGTPAVLFLLLFVRLYTGLPLLALLLAAGWYATRELPRSAGAWVPAAAGALVVAFICGFPHGPYSWDWIKHWALLKELSGHRWPLGIELEGQPAFLRYYVGAYLVPALVHRLLPQIPLWIPTALWFALGFALVLRMATALSTRPAQQWLAVALVLLLGGADAFGDYAYRWFYDYPTPLIPMFGLHHEAWQNYLFGIPLEYSAVITAFSWVPHQAIAAFLVAGLLVDRPSERELPAVFLAFGLLALWSPYAVIGLFPFVGLAAYQHRAILLKRPVLVAAGGGAAFALLVVWYLSTDLPTSGACFACVPTRLAHFHTFLPFLLVELLPFVLLLGARAWTEIPCRTAILILLVIPLAYGDRGDFVMRASLGPLFILGLAGIRALLSDWDASRRRLFHAAALLLCAPSAISEMVYLRTAGQAHLAFPRGDSLHALWLTGFIYRDDFTAVEFLNRCGWDLAPPVLHAQGACHFPALVRYPGGPAAGREASAAVTERRRRQPRPFLIRVCLRLATEADGTCLAFPQGPLHGPFTLAIMSLAQYWLTDSRHVGLVLAARTIARLRARARAHRIFRRDRELAPVSRRVAGRGLLRCVRVCPVRQRIHPVRSHPEERRRAGRHACGVSLLPDRGRNRTVHVVGHSLADRPAAQPRCCRCAAREPDLLAAAAKRGEPDTRWCAGCRDPALRLRVFASVEPGSACVGRR